MYKLLCLIFILFLVSGCDKNKPSPELKECAREAQELKKDFGVHCGHLLKD